MPHPSRRQFLAGAGTTLLAATAGCSLLTESTDPLPVRLENETDSEHTFTVQVRIMDQALLSVDRTLAGGESVEYTVDQPPEQTTVTVGAAVDGDQETTEQVTIGPGSGTLAVAIVLDSDENLAVLTAVEES